MGVEVEPGVYENVVADDEDVAGPTQLDKPVARFVQPCGEGRQHVVGSPDGDRGARQQSGGPTGVGRDIADHLPDAAHWRQPVCG